VGADGKVFIANAAGAVAVISATREWETLRVNDLRESIYATPAIVDGTILLRTERALWAFRQWDAHTVSPTSAIRRGNPEI
jgi:hypothetical protein